VFIGGVGLGTSLAQIQARKDIRLSLDSDGNPYGEETFTFAYGEAPAALQLDGDVVFGLRDNVVSSITVTHTLHSMNCEDSGIAEWIKKEQIHDWGAPLKWTMPAATREGDGATVSYTFRSNDTDMILVLRTVSAAGTAPTCSVSMNYRPSTGAK
jgi:hypothetical protein